MRTLGLLHLRTWLAVGDGGGRGSSAKLVFICPMLAYIQHNDRLDLNTPSIPYPPSVHTIILTGYLWDEVGRCRCDGVGRGYRPMK